MSSPSSISDWSSSGSSSSRVISSVAASTTSRFSVDDNNLQTSDARNPLVLPLLHDDRDWVLVPEAPAHFTAEMAANYWRHVDRLAWLTVDNPMGAPQEISARGPSLPPLRSPSLPPSPPPPSSPRSPLPEHRSLIVKLGKRSREQRRRQEEEEEEEEEVEWYAEAQAEADDDGVVVDIDLDLDTERTPRDTEPLWECFIPSYEVYMRRIQLKDGAGVPTPVCRQGRSHEGNGPGCSYCEGQHIGSKKPQARARAVRRSEAATAFGNFTLEAMAAARVRKFPRLAGKFGDEIAC